MSLDLGGNSCRICDGRSKEVDINRKVFQNLGDGVSKCMSMRHSGGGAVFLLIKQDR